MIDIFCFPDSKVKKKTCCKFGIIKCFLYLNLTDTDRYTDRQIHMFLYVLMSVF